MERDPWWRVDLGSTKGVGRVIVFKRLPQIWGKWLEGFQIYVGDNPDVMKNPTCGEKQSVAVKDVISVDCGGMKGRYVGIALPDKKQYLILCEVEVYGVTSETCTPRVSTKMSKAPPKLGQCAGSKDNIAAKRPAVQSSTDFKGDAARAVDGDRNPIYGRRSCTHTAMEHNPWWRVDLGSSRCVDRVVIVKRQPPQFGDWLNGFKVYVGDNPNVMENHSCGGTQSVTGKDVITVSCGGLTGRYVGIALPHKRQYLILCEVEVYGA
ncbi:fucolectin-6-like [Branchiostoma lanceolatum]|uniref:fucolectin-6-like n=1 Tax=Branchiostoma lanceolatum TaxID=7740 RepID=UPI003456CAFD